MGLNSRSVVYAPLAYSQAMFCQTAATILVIFKGALSTIEQFTVLLAVLLGDVHKRFGFTNQLLDMRGCLNRYCRLHTLLVSLILREFQLYFNGFFYPVSCSQDLILILELYTIARFIVFKTWNLLPFYVFLTHLLHHLPTLLILRTNPKTGHIFLSRQPT